MKKTLGKSSLTHEEMNTVLCDCESFINSRLLTYISEDPEDLEPLTPAMFLQDIRKIGVREFDNIEANKLKNKFAYRVKVKRDLRKRFRTEYLGQLREAYKVKRESILKEGEIVLLGNDHTKRLNWNLGHIVKLYPGKDHRVRLALVKTAYGSFLRPVQKLFPLEVQEKEKISLCPINFPSFVETLDPGTEGRPEEENTSCQSCSNDGAVLERITENFSASTDDSTPTRQSEPRRSRYGRLIKSNQRK
ncbi:hypothetical protein X975_10433, partial [Stegodyphus mimosarum]